MSEARILNCETLYAGKVIDVNREQVELPDGAEVALEIVRHPGGAATVALDDQDRVCLLRQFRHAAGGWLWELPAGRIDPDETPQRTAARELAEEAGLVAEDWTDLGPMHATPGVFTEVIHLWLARGLSTQPVAHEPGELIEVHWLPFSQALDWCHDATITDAKTLIGIYRAKAMIQNDLDLLSEGAGC
ncbi:NUDIX hydrolase [Marichromatium bheemlicum]|uniref:GDP-mannose pyrophosphatase n=1 Tax=Marichromatium bheemlicum TaxID=365339 RepID=A0ABX1I6B1_9GAMM|nr:NUDIX hydrolase [Marichromatium bheemlicum]NKN32594.1 NUDIX hydrolase [Marichromatium bheemlicum]